MGVLLLAGVPFVMQSIAAPPLEPAKARTLPMELPASAMRACKDECELRLEGVNLASQPVIAVLRIDDSQSKSYATRFNEEFNIPLGPFSISKSLSDLRAVDGRAIDPGSVSRVLLFQASAEPGILVRAFEIRRASTSAGEGPAVTPAASPAAESGHDAQPAPAITLARPGALPIDVPTAPLRNCLKNCEIVVEGTVTGTTPVVVVLRVDDGQSTSYATRVNEERTLPPGPFKWRKPLSGLRTVNGRVVDHRAIAKMMMFNGSSQARVEIASFKLVETQALPMKAIGLSFGAPDAPLMSGFERVGPSDPRLTGQMFVMRRPAPDPLVANGLRGIQKVVVPYPKGFARVSLWTEDPGEWESLPHPLERQISINGREVLNQRLTPPQWIKQRYLAGSDQEPSGNADAWTTFGQHRGGLITAEVEVGDAGIIVEQAGDSPAAMFLSGMVIEPAGQRAALDAVLEQRARWYREIWPIGAPIPHKSAHEVAIAADERAAAREPGAPLRLTLTPGTGARAVIAVSSAEPISTPDVAITPPKTESSPAGLKTQVWAAQRQLDRANVSSNLLVLKDERLRSMTRRFPILPGEPRRYDVWIEAPADAAPGIYKGRITIGDERRAAALDVQVEMLPVKLPPVAKPAGFFNDEAPHLLWFSWPGDVRRRQMGCDLATLGRFGLDGNAPGLSTPVFNRNDDLMRDAQIAMQAGTRLPMMAYAGAGRAFSSQGLTGSVQSIADIEQRFIDKGYERLLWSVADEPSNPDMAGGDLKGWIKALRAGAPGIRLTAHLNNKADRALIPLFDVAIVNGGYGIDAPDLADIAAKGVEPWLYNTEQYRFTAGLWLWNTPARHYVQWHARLPTADPFDPTDGREGDAQMFYPSMELCPAQPDMNAKVLEMAEGVIDQRWLLWLETRQEPDARALLQRIKGELGSSFAIAERFDDARMAALRDSIIDLARHTN
ncbi:MAG: hypothetical protein K2P80_01210 [Beijerinckiaceae bacterium]|nr:hypothetical protein [Beijerinckiaceae bacterium]